MYCEIMMLGIIKLKFTGTTLNKTLNNSNQYNMPWNFFFDKDDLGKRGYTSIEGVFFEKGSERYMFDLQGNW